MPAFSGLAYFKTSWFQRLNLSIVVLHGATMRLHEFAAFRTWTCSNTVAEKSTLRCLCFGKWVCNCGLKYRVNRMHNFTGSQAWNRAWIWTRSSSSSFGTICWMKRWKHWPLAVCVNVRQVAIWQWHMEGHFPAVTMWGSSPLSPCITTLAPSPQLPWSIPHFPWFP